jgi:hypothetical protein
MKDADNRSTEAPVLRQLDEDPSHNEKQHDDYENRPSHRLAVEVLVEAAASLEEPLELRIGLRRARLQILPLCRDRSRNIELPRDVGPRLGDENLRLVERIASLKTRLLYRSL